MIQETYRTKCPCKGCTDREVGCHALCDKYISWSDFQNTKKEEIRREKQIFSDHYYLPSRRTR